MRRPGIARGEDCSISHYLPILIFLPSYLIGSLREAEKKVFFSVRTTEGEGVKDRPLRKKKMKLEKKSEKCL